MTSEVEYHRWGLSYVSPSPLNDAPFELSTCGPVAILAVAGVRIMDGLTSGNATITSRFLSCNQKILTVSPKN